eukprot:CAMPEP_0201488784 /NCGR_PEP_ID=MMETSP0151_2-20130828/19378_1 /ASSEMBLY_ACC=CAM_ASM_000257 /TAXON_ID=200890 /ORGANISM="Paramoeba atlantica, Strain 621/1 / CCAP 1560/9" /LENGTH=322 /DNA_ID=CAMNT_0047874141 /DNA_START=30 /DNA_END=995 /DNA_ORIENTATION=+
MGAEHGKEEDLIVGRKDDARRIQYGNRGAPISLFAGELEPELLQRIQELAIFSCPESELVNLGFQRCVDYPHLPQHIYYEGYFHSRESAEPFPSLCPRNGAEFPKPPAPPLLRAFYCAFRQKNAKWLQDIANKFSELKYDGEDFKNQRQAGLELFPKLFCQSKEDSDIGDWLVGDLAVQVHYGHPVERGNIGFHTDSINSLFHFAMAVRGKRKLHSFRAEDAKRSHEREFQQYVNPQEEGDIYISSPAMFRHGVEYPKSNWENRTVAIQARFLYTEETYSKMATFMGSALENEMTKIIADALIIGPQLPTLKEVEEIEATLK